jgi:hypothetical protein
MWRDWVAPGSIATDITTVACACDQSFSPGLDEEEQDGMFSWPTKLQKASSERPSFQVADCRGASPNGYFATVPRPPPRPLATRTRRQIAGTARGSGIYFLCQGS